MLSLSVLLFAVAARAASVRVEWAAAPATAPVVGALAPLVREQYDLLQLPAEHGNDVSGFPESAKHKNLLPVDIRDAICILIAAVTLFIAAGGGIGGGGVLVPLYILGLQFQTEHAVALSNLTIAGGAFANLICNLPRRHPVANRPLIDWDLILVMEPMTILGAVLGGFLNKLAPVWITTTLMCLLLLVMSQKLWRKAKSTYDIETITISSSNHSNALSEGSSGSNESEHLEPLLEDGPHSPNKATIERIYVEIASANRDPSVANALEMIESDAVRVPAAKVLALTGMFLWLLLSDTWKADVPCGGAAYWLLVLSIVPVVAVMMIVVRRYLLRKAVLRERVGLVPEKGDIDWNPRTTITYPTLCSLAGLVAGMFGVGGGIIKGPLMLAMGVLPEVAAATSATMILFTTGSASVVYLTFGGIKWDYAALLMVLAFVVTFLGQVLTYHVIAKFGRRSIIIVAMALLLSSGAIIMAYESVGAVLDAVEGGMLRVGDICH